MQWIPAHCGVYGNKTAHRLVKEEALLEQRDRQVSFSDEKTVIKALTKKRLHQQHPGYKQSNSYYSLNRADQVILFRLRTGHNRLRAHLFTKLRIGETDICPCGTEPMTAEHLLQNCPLHADRRQETWPKETSLRERLYGTQEALQRTARFVRATGIYI